jgi:hypothetical protein
MPESRHPAPNLARETIRQLAVQFISHAPHFNNSRNLNGRTNDKTPVEVFDMVSFDQYTMKFYSE